ncbi:hypothetical protein [uncultured Clostridium sp.]|uniref:hypothetical protein n=1 Tax=uncultured Clostridium sp. TaxID=59620 RepID=UPI0028EA598C|nr:hypothetical protein [uncultured Clostridium sp.]
MNNIPINIPKNMAYKYVYILEKSYDEVLKMIYDVGIYAAHRQFYALYKKLHPSLSDNYIKKKCTQIIKELEEHGFISVNNINKNKYLYLNKPAIALFTGDYKKTKVINHEQDLKNDKFLISLMKLEYYINNDFIINNSNLMHHLYSLTKRIHGAKLQFSNLDYSINDLEYIINQKDYNKILEKVNEYPSDNLLKIIWIDIYKVFRKLLLQNQTVALTPTYFKLFKIGNKLSIHYVPDILIWDLHDNKYYERKINNLFDDFIGITNNNIKDIHLNFSKSSILGNKQNNHIGYSLTLIGYNEDVLIRKVNHINKYIVGNPHTPIVKGAEYIYIDIAKYIDHASQYNSSIANADNYVDTNLNNLIKSL